MRKQGIEIEFYKDKRTGRRIIHIRGVKGKKEATGASGVRNNAEMVASKACKSSLLNDEKDTQPVISCRLEGVVSVQPKSLSLYGGIQKADKRGWLEMLKRWFARIAR